MENYNAAIHVFKGIATRIRPISIVCKANPQVHSVVHFSIYLSCIISELVKYEIPQK